MGIIIISSVSRVGQLAVRRLPIVSSIVVSSRSACSRGIVTVRVYPNLRENLRISRFEVAKTEVGPLLSIYFDHAADNL